MNFRRIFTFLGICSLCASAFAAAGETSAQDTAHFQRFAALPVLGYSEVTGWEYGAMLLLFAKPDSGAAEGSSADIAAYATQRKQFQAIFDPSLYFLQGRVHVDASFYYWNWTSHYYGIGNDPDRDRSSRYDMTRYVAEIPVEMNFGLPEGSPFRYGLVFNAERNHVNFKDGGDVAEPENSGGTRLGFGYKISFDTREQLNSPEHGFYAAWTQSRYSSTFGDFGYLSQSLDLRGYMPVIWNTTLATGWFWDMRKGKVPFDALATLDGYKRFRGVEKGLFSDNQALVWQAELRKPLFWRLGGTIFFEAGKVGPDFGALAGNKWHRAVGFGGRLALNRSERLNARGDFSLVDGKYLGMTVYIREAF